MKFRTYPFLAIVLLLLALQSACKKKPSIAASTCKTQLHGYTVSFDSLYSGGPLRGCSHIVINTTNGRAGIKGAFNGYMTIFSPSAFNPSDNCYYVFGRVDNSGPLCLYKINEDGTTTVLQMPPVNSCSGSLVYNGATKALYTIINGSIAKITPGTSSVSVQSVAKATHLSSISGESGITADSTTGNMYYLTYDETPGFPYTTYIERCRPGDTVTSVIGSYSSMDHNPIQQLHFNTNDKMMYGLEDDFGSGYNFLKIDPSSGAISTIVNMHIIYPNWYSATIDQCANRYIISTVSSVNSYAGILYQLSMEGKPLQIDTTATFYTGLAD